MYLFVHSEWSVFMYCYSCGNKIISNLEKCPYCNENLDKIQTLLEDSFISSIGKSYPIFHAENIEQFVIDNNTIEIKELLSLKCFLSNIYFRCYRNMLKKFMEFYYKYGIERIAKDAFGIIDELNNKLLIFTTAFLNKNEIYLDITTTAEEIGYLKPDWSLGAFDELLIKLKMYKEESAEMREQIKLQRSGYWVGGGFGVRGAIRGRVMAGALNTGESLLNLAAEGILKSAVKHISESDADKRAEKLKKEPEIINNIERGFQAYAGKHFEFALKKFADKLGYKCTPCELFDMLKSKDHPYNGIKNEIERISENPFDIGCYVNIYQHCSSERKALRKLADYTGLGYVIVYKKWLEIDLEAKAPWYNEDWFDSMHLEKKEIQERLNLLAEYENCNPLYTASFSKIREIPYKEVQLFTKIKNDLLYYYDLNTVMEISDDVRQNIANENYDILFSMYNTRNGFAPCIILNLIYEQLTDTTDENSDKYFQTFSEKINTISDTNVVARDVFTVLSLKLMDKLRRKPTGDILRELWKRAIDGSALCMGYLGVCYYYGIFFRQDKESGAEFLIKSALNKCPLAMGYVGDFYKNGSYGLLRDNLTATQFFNIAAECGVVYAKNALKG